ncbi:MAG: MerC family mercury resistance protein [Acidimicrobiia bacterium]|nr:MerC family mercury resistance protein [Acidimicrobiia bacterium]
MVPSIGAAFLPKLTCPACWPAYGGLLRSLGIGFVDYTPYLLPLTGAFLTIAVLALAYGAPTRRGYGPFALGVVGATIVMIGKFGFDSDPAMWVGLCILVATSLWNT